MSATEVSICNMALSRIGDVATVTSIDPPEGSAQAQHCEQFYPIARDALLELHDWNFASKREVLSQVDSQTTAWEYAYRLPSDLIKARKLMGIESQDDEDYIPYEIEVLEDEQLVLYTNQCDAVLRYTYQAKNPAVFSPLFVISLSWYLASYLAGPIITGAEGEATANRAEAKAIAYFGQGGMSDSNQRQTDNVHTPGHLGVRA